ncbi:MULTISPECIES: substrate-binding domain-containing protein [Sporosarcina]|uniref:substrate-binding domain-containing protein n=1 Tax=Sporosarcina TaxID=1569 RepID=UPI00058EB3E0|nr:MULTISPECIES: helix-turn-helix transcriptional regulator [Sporosarcina]WJY28339.1 helix-turn-helix transcriptional regulator [Sporosarcina sp. 0.2-SM1T-5]
MKPNDGISYTTEDLAEFLQVSKLTVYDLIKKGEITAYRVGRQMRVDAADFEAYKNRMKGGRLSVSAAEAPVAKAPPVNQQYETTSPPAAPHPRTVQPLIISGQDVTLDLLANEISASSAGWRTLRSHTGSLANLIALLQGDADLVSTHLFDGDTGSYNLPYIRRLLTGREYTVIQMLSRKAGFYVQPGNPKQIMSWRDLNRNDIRFVNRELGSGIRVLTDERLRLEGILPRTISGYSTIEQTHLAVAGKVAAGEADTGVGIEKAASLVNVDFVPITTEQYDLVMLKKPENAEFRDTVIRILQSESFRKELASIQGYDFSRMGQILYDTP